MELTCCFLLCPKPLPWAPAVWPALCCLGVSVPTLLLEYPASFGLGETQLPQESAECTSARRCPEFFPAVGGEWGTHPQDEKGSPWRARHTPLLAPGPYPKNGQMVITIVPPPLPPPSLLGSGSKTRKWTSVCPSFFGLTCSVCVVANPPKPGA